MIKDYLHLHFIVLIWGFTAVLGVLISIPSVEIVFYRTLFAAAFLAIMVYYQRLTFFPGKHAIIQLMLTGSLIAAHWIFFFGSAKVSNVSVCLAGMATTSFWTSLLEPVMFRRRIRWFEVSLGLIVIFGLYIIFHFEFNHALGLSMALFSAFLAALFTVINANHTKIYHHHVITMYEMLGACLSIVICFPLYKWTFAEMQILQLKMSMMDLFYILILAIVCTVYAYSASIELMKRITAFTVNLTVNLEPVYGIILAVIIFGEKEKMQPEFYLGAVIILLSVISHPILTRLYQRRHIRAENVG